jgi:hypothetical protein
MPPPGEALFQPSLMSYLLLALRRNVSEATSVGLERGGGTGERLPALDRHVDVLRH